MPRNSFCLLQKASARTRLYQSCKRGVTGGTALQAGSVGCDEGRVACLPGLPNAHFERAAHDVAPVELHVDRVDAVLVRDEPNGVLICKRGGAFLIRQRTISQRLNPAQGCSAT